MSSHDEPLIKMDALLFFYRCWDLPEFHVNVFISYGIYFNRLMYILIEFNRYMLFTSFYGAVCELRSRNHDGHGHGEDHRSLQGHGEGVASGGQILFGNAI